ncbi:hypothetical protein DBR06_SOUSAS910261, partial [Sousa chinensis]
PPSASKGPGQMATITCTGNSNNMGNQGAAWLQQHTGCVLKLLTHKCVNRLSGITERFVGSGSRQTGLSLSGLQPGDEANYYCSAWD